MEGERREERMRSISKWEDFREKRDLVINRFVKAKERGKVLREMVERVLVRRVLVGC